jgi:hypothetical protein
MVARVPKPKSLFVKDIVCVTQSVDLFEQKLSHGSRRNFARDQSQGHRQLNADVDLMCHDGA